MFLNFWEKKNWNLKKTAKDLSWSAFTAGRMFASSSFYSPFHPSMQEQVELARQISHSLSAADNRLSKGQTMYVKRRNRSMKWIHEGELTAL